MTPKIFIPFFRIEDTVYVQVLIQSIKQTGGPRPTVFCVSQQLHAKPLDADRVLIKHHNWLPDDERRGFYVNHPHILNLFFILENVTEPVLILQPDIIISHADFWKMSFDGPAIHCTPWKIYSNYPALMPESEPVIPDLYLEREKYSALDDSIFYIPDPVPFYQAVLQLQRTKLSKNALVPLNCWLFLRACKLANLSFFVIPDAYAYCEFGAIPRPENIYARTAKGAQRPLDVFSKPMNWAKVTDIMSWPDYQYWASHYRAIIH